MCTTNCTIYTTNCDFSLNSDKINKNDFKIRNIKKKLLQYKLVI